MRILPKLTDSFLGREKELRRLGEFIPRCHLFILKGIGGIGKTTLALALLGELKKQGLENSVFWIECLEGWRLEDFFLEVDSWLKKSGEQGFSPWIKGQKKDLKEKILFLINILNEKKFILFVDDFHLIQDKNIKVFLNLLNTYLSSRIIIISREDIPASHFEKLDIFEEKLEGLPVENAVHLLKNLLDLHKLTSQPDSENLSKIAGKVGGHPLLLKLAASLIIARSLDIEKIFFEGTIVEIEDYIFFNILKNVSSKERKILNILALTVIPIAEDAIKPMLDIKDVREIIASLERKFLLERDASGSVFIHQLIAEYLANDMNEDFKRSLHGKLGEYFEKIGLQQEAFSHFLDGNELLKASQILADSALMMYSRGQYELLIEDSNRLEKAAKNIDPKVLIMKANALSILGRWEESLAILQKVETLTSDKSLVAESAASSAGVYLNIGNVGKAFSLYEKSLKLAKAASNSGIAKKCLIYMALICGVRGEIDRGRKLLQKSMDLSSGDENKEEQAFVLRVKGAIHNTVEEYDEALKIGKESLKLASDMASARMICGARDTIGHAYFGMGRLDEAKALSEENLRDAKKAGDTVVIASSLLQLGNIAEEKGEYQEAIESFTAAAQCFTGQGNLLNEAIANHYLSTVLINLDREDEALNIYNKYLEIVKNFDHYGFEAASLLKLTEIYLDKGDIDKASDFGSKSLSLVEKLELPKLKAEAHLCLAEISLIRHKDLQAKKYVENCFHLLDINKHPEKFHRAYYILSAIPSESKLRREKNAVRAGKLLENLSGSKKRSAERFLQRFKSILSKKFCIYTKEEEYIANEIVAEHLRANKDSYEFFMDIPKEQLFIRGEGEVDVFRKKILSTLLLFFVSNAGKRFTSEELFTSVWGYKIEGEKSAEDVRTNISRLRTLMEPDRKNPRFIKHSKPFMKEKGKYYFDKDINFCLISNTP